MNYELMRVNLNKKTLRMLSQGFLLSILNPFFNYNFLILIFLNQTGSP